MKSVFGLNENVVSALTYVPCIGFVCGVAALCLEQTNKFVRFHALQSIVFNIFLFVLNIVVNFFGFVPLLGGLVSWLFGVLSLVSALYLIYQAAIGKTFKIPYIGDAVWAQVNK